MSVAFLEGSEQYYLAAVQRQEQEKAKSPGFRLIDRANEVSIFDVLQDFFDRYVPRDGESFKSECPFSYEHADGGLDKGWRTYPGSNSSYCFPLHGFMPPVRLIHLKYGERPVKAAERILRFYDLLRPRHYDQRMNELLAETERENEPTIGNPQHVVEAINLALAHMPSYQTRQFDTEVLEAMEKVLASLDVVLLRNDPDLLRKWYHRVVAALHQVVERDQ